MRSCVLRADGTYQAPAFSFACRYAENTCHDCLQMMTIISIWYIWGLSEMPSLLYIYTYCILLNKIAYIWNKISMKFVAERIKMPTFVDDFFPIFVDLTEYICAREIAKLDTI